jgi:hypothetical protein
MIVTETEQVLVNLQKNLDRNSTLPSPNYHYHCYYYKSDTTCCCLDWEHYERDAAANEHSTYSYDTIWEPTCCFATRFVRPLLQVTQFLSIAPVPSTGSEYNKTVNIYLITD